MVNKKELKVGTIIKGIYPRGNERYGVIYSKTKANKGNLVFMVRDLVDDVRNIASFFKGAGPDSSWGFGEGLIDVSVIKIIPKSEVIGKRISFTDIIIEKGKKIKF